MAAGVAEEQQLGHYALVREAGHGGMSVVYEARDTRIGRRVALKVVTVPPHLTAGQREEMLARLGREARAVARLSHPNIVFIYDIGEEADRHFLVMEYLDGRTLRDRLTHSPLPAAEAAVILDQVADALDAVHAEGVTHRDIKSSNVMLMPDGRAKLMDFGVARQVDDTMVTQAGMMVGSPVYMAPELIGGAEANAASDLWSLGVLLYEMLAGKPPFTGRTIPVVLYQVTHEPIPPVPGLPPAVQSVLARALDRDPAHRYPSARALAVAFHEAVAPRQPRVSLPTTPPVGRKTRRHSRAPWGLAALMIAALAGGVALHHPHRPTARGATESPLHRKAKPLLVAKSLAPVMFVARRPAVRVADMRQERKARAARHRRHRHWVIPALVPSRDIAPPAVASGETAPRHPRHARRVAARTPGPRWKRSYTASAAPPPAPARTGPSALLGTWHGTNTRNPATLTITHAHPGGFDGVMTVHTREALVRVAVTGHVSGGHIAMHETRVLSQSRPRAWDLGSEYGSLGSGGRMGGSGTDVKGRVGRWDFSR